MRLRALVIALTSVLALALGAPAALADGQVVDAAGQQMWISCTGTGSPTIVLVNGLTSSHSVWDKVVGPMAKKSRVCVTDRPGLGSSPKRTGSTVTDAGQHATELEAALTAAGEHGPYLIVAHSYGGLIARAFHAKYPKEVAGLMLVDAVYPGIQRTFLPSYKGPWFEGGTTIDMDASEQATKGGPKYGNLPLVVITADDNDNILSWADTQWNKQQAKAAKLSSNSKHWMAKGSGHTVQQDRPGYVLKGANWLLKQSRAQQAAARS